MNILTTVLRLGVLFSALAWPPLGPNSTPQGFFMALWAPRSDPDDDDDDENRQKIYEKFPGVPRSPWRPPRRPPGGS